MIKLNLDSTYEVPYVSDDLRDFSFTSMLKDGSSVDLFVQIRTHHIRYLSEVYNLGFGPLDANGEIDDTIILNHADVHKVFSTILICAITFLKNSDPGYLIGIDGSNDARAYLYHRMFSYNRELLSGLIASIGVDWYVRLMRNGADIERNADQSPLFKPRPEPFDCARKSIDLYRYYLFSLK